jgi:imidazoleglycerol-phosphate dehydratase
MTPRIAEVNRDTKETRGSVRVNLDGTGESDLSTGIGFFDHMLDQIARHGLIDLKIHAKWRLAHRRPPHGRRRGHHLGPGGGASGGRQKGIRRYGHAYVPLDEALSRVVVDFSGRPGLEMHVPFKSGGIGRFRLPAGV